MAFGKKTTIVSKGSGGVNVPAPKRVGGLKVRSKAVETDAKKIKIMNEARLKALATRKKKSVCKQASVAGASLAQASSHIERDFITSWLDDRPFIVSFVSGLMRNGLLEQNYLDQSKPPMAMKVDAGIRVFAEGATKWRSVRMSVAAKLLADLLQLPEVPEWFKGDAKLPAELGLKALLFVLGVTESTPIPKGHSFGAYYKPLLWLCKRQLIAIGCKLKSPFTKDKIDHETDYFVLDTTGKHILCQDVKRTEVKFGFDISKLTDLVITNGSDYEEARLVSEEASLDTLLARAYEKHNAPPTHSLEFHFPKDASPPGIPNENAVGTQSASSSSSVGSGVVNAAVVNAGAGQKSIVPAPPA
jgi:hypothetical protein